MNRCHVMSFYDNVIILSPPSIFSVARCFDISMFVEYHDLIDIVPLHPLVTHILRLPELLTVRVQGLKRTYNNKASLARPSED